MLALPPLGPVLLGAPAAIRATLRQDASGLWLFEDGATLGLDASRQGNTLTNNNSVSQVAGRVGQAANFVRASSQYLSKASGAAFITSGPYSIAGWVNHTTLVSFSGFGFALSNTSGDVGNWIVHTTTGGALGFVNWRSVADTTAEHRTANGVMVTGTWQHWACVWDGISSLVYVNGAAVATSVLDPGIGWHTGFSLGRDDTAATSYLNGSLDDVIYLPRALSAAELAWLAAGNALA